MPARDPTHRVLIARTAALSRWAKEDATNGTATARDAFNRRFQDEVDPDGALPEAERARRAKAARKAYFSRLALARHRKALVAKKAGGNDAPAA